METPLNIRFGPAAIGPIAAIIRGGGLAVLPTDTIYGIHCNASDPAAVRRVRRLKGRGSGGFVLLASSTEMVDALVSGWPDRSRAILDRLWPGPVTAILPAAASVDAALRPRGRVALRVPGHAALTSLIETVGSPLVSTSVNRRGEAPMSRIDAIRARFPGLEAYAGRSGPCAGLPSTVVDLTGQAPAIVRGGAGADRVRAAIEPLRKGI